MLTAGLLAVAWIGVPAGGGAAADGVVTAAATEPDYELFYRVEAELRSRRVDADLRAAGRLRMAAARATDGRLTLALEEPLEPPWKLYRVDPVGPFGREVKLAAVATLPEGSWSALDRAMAETQALGKSQYQLWREATGRRDPFDGAYAFVVIGPPAGRFTVEVGADGGVDRVDNRLTDRWLPGEFGRWVQAWDPAWEGPHGYWFWNRGESEPLAYEPHTYHALEAALRLLELPLSPAEAATAWPRPVEEAWAVVETLAPKLAGRRRRPGPEELELTSRHEGAQGLRLDGAWAQGRAKLRVLREAFRAQNGGPARDRLVLELEETAGRLRVEVGYRPLEPG